mmetsp:Transcript_15840/g.23182  ORF Transcript_15840/g.23182 Transcript_15840/m.23182 type:complete len:84 (+) Transcript_15840:1873-2124(+)
MNDWEHTLGDREDVHASAGHQLHPPEAMNDNHRGVGSGLNDLKCSCVGIPLESNSLVNGFAFPAISACRLLLAPGESSEMTAG